MIPIYGVERHNNDCFAVPPYFHLFILAQDDEVPFPSTLRDCTMEPF